MLNINSKFADLPISVGLQNGELLWRLQTLEKSFSILEVDGVVLDARIESPLEAVFPQVVAGEDPKCLVVDVTFRSPQGPQF